MLKETHCQYFSNQLIVFWTYWKSECANLHMHAHMHVQWPPLFLMISCSVVYLFLFLLLSYFSSPFYPPLIFLCADWCMKGRNLFHGQTEWRKSGLTPFYTNVEKLLIRMLPHYVACDIPTALCALLIRFVTLWSARVDKNSFPLIFVSIAWSHSSPQTARKFIFTASHKLKSPSILTK